MVSGASGPAPRGPLESSLSGEACPAGHLSSSQRNRWVTGPRSVHSAGTALRREGRWASPGNKSNEGLSSACSQAGSSTVSRGPLPGPLPEPPVTGCGRWWVPTPRDRPCPMRVRAAVEMARGGFSQVPSSGL